MTRRWMSAGLCAALALGGVIVYACTTDTAIGPDVALDSLYIEPASAVIVVSDTLHLTAVGVDTSGRRFANTRVTWSSHDPTITLTSNGTAIAISVGTATVTATAGRHTATASLTIQPKPAIATSRDSVVFTVIANGPTPAPQTVTITNGGGGTLTPVVDSIHYGSGNPGWLGASITGSGTDTLTLSATTSTLGVGTYTATVFLSSPKAAQKPIKVVLTVGVGAPYAMAIDSGNAQTATVNTSVLVKPTVLVRDQYNNPVPAASITFSVTGGGGTVAPVTAVATDAGGRARATSWTLGTTAAANTLQAQAAGVTPVTFTATGTAGAPAATSKTAGDTQSVTVNTAVSVAPTLRVTDQFGNPVESVTVTFNVASGGGALTSGTKKTDVSGLAAVGSWTLGKVAGANTLAATAASLPTATFAATANPDAADSLNLSGGNNQTDTVKATLATPCTVRVSDQYGNGVPGKTVTWGVTGGGSITATSVTNSSGIANATRVFGTVAGSQGAAATLAGLIGSPVSFNATATHGAPTTILKFAGDGQSATAGSAVAIPPVARVVDQYGNSVSGLNVAFAVTAGGGSVVPTTAIPTDTAGKAAVSSWTLGASAGSNNNTVTASATGVPSAAFVASGLSGNAKNLVYVSGDAQTDTIGASLAAYTVKVTDINNNGVQSVTVSWLVTTGGGSITASSVTDVNGVATATRVLGTVVGFDSATASVGGLTGSPRAFGATALHGNAAQIIKTMGDAQSATVNTAVPTAPQVRITDRANNPIQSASVTLSVASGGGSTVPASPATLSTDVNGLVQLTSWTLGTTAGGNTISATATGTPGATFSATGTAGAPSASQSTVAGNAVSTTACSVGCTVAAGTADSVTVTVRDQFNNLVSGATVTLGATGSGNAFSPSASGTSNASGIYAAKLNSTVAEAKTISATATTGLGGGAITQTAGVTVNPAGVSSSQSSLMVGTPSITACSTSCVAGSTASTITITVRDAFNNVISGATVTPASNGTGNTLNPASGPSIGSGVFTTTFNSIVAQGKTISATANAVAITQTGGVTVTAAAPASVTVANQAQKARVGAGVSTLPTFTVRDAFSNPVTGYAVTIGAGGGGSLSPTATNTDGIGQVTLASWTMGPSATEVAGGMINTATLSAGSATATATDTGFYSWSLDVNALIGTGSVCASCHGFAISGYSGEVGVAASCNAAYNLVQASSAGASMIYLKLINAQPTGCGAQMPPSPTYSPYNASQLKIVRTWINRSALNN
jgi:adhesin/invasin